MPAAPLVIGVDGGGTKTDAWLAPLDDGGASPVLGRGTAGPGNPRAVGFEVAQANIGAAIKAAFSDAKLEPATAAAACFGLAGAGRGDEQERIIAWAHSHAIAQKVQVCGDAELVLAAASPDNCGIALISGTGSLAWGRNAAGETARTGGWGYLLGDEGSGYAIALAGLRTAMRAADGRGPDTDLLPAFVNKLGANSPQELVAKVYAPDMTRERLAQLVSVVFDCRSTDKAAERIIEEAAGDLAEMVATVAARLHLPAEGWILAMAGGVLLHQVNYHEQVFNAIWSRLYSLGSLAVQWSHVEEPVLGAVMLARQLASS